jgi:hypothetical protein
MLGGKEKLDILIGQNADKLLADVDWEALNAAVSTRLEQVPRTIKHRPIFKIAAGIVAAAVVLIVMITVPLRQKQQSGAIVKFIEPKSSASVKIKGTASSGLAIIEVENGGKMAAKCDVKIIDSDGKPEEERSKAAWIIITRQEPALADNGFKRYERDLICLF